MDWSAIWFWFMCIGSGVTVLGLLLMLTSHESLTVFVFIVGLLLAFTGFFSDTIRKTNIASVKEQWALAAQVKAEAKAEKSCVAGITLECQKGVEALERGDVRRQYWPLLYHTKTGKPLTYLEH